MKRPSKISSKLKNADVTLVDYVVELENKISEFFKENATLQKKNAKMEVQNISNQNKIKALEKLASEEKIIIKGNFDKV